MKIETTLEQMQDSYDRKEAFRALREEAEKAFRERDECKAALVKALNERDVAQAEVERLRDVYEQAVRGRQDFRSAFAELRLKNDGEIEHASWKMFADPRVKALVKAVLEACDYALPDQVMALLTKAVEPFEVKP